jgi:hypothetical protein
MLSATSHAKTIMLSPRLRHSLNLKASEPNL